MHEPINEKGAWELRAQSDKVRKKTTIIYIVSLNDPDPISHMNVTELHQTKYDTVQYTTYWHCMSAIHIIFVLLMVNM